jgi:hypothetical protein
MPQFTSIPKGGAPMKQPKERVTRTVDEVAEILGINRGGA